MPKKSILGDFLATDVLSKTFDNGITNVSYEKIKPAPDNRDIGDISDLAEDIAENGLNSNLVVRKIDDPDYDYELIGGHRRFAAINHAIKQGRKGLDLIPCKIASKSDDDAYISLIMDNALVKPLTQSEMLHAIERLKEIYKRKKASGESIPGRVNNLISEVVGLGKSQVANYEKVLNHAIPEIINQIDNGKMSINVAAEIASLEENDQLAFIDTVDEYDINGVRNFKQGLQHLNESSLKEADEEYWKEIDEHIKMKKNNDIKIVVPDSEKEFSRNPDFSIKCLQNALCSKFGTSVTIAKNKLSFRFVDIDDLNRILEIMDCLLD